MDHVDRMQNAESNLIVPDARALQATLEIRSLVVFPMSHVRHTVRSYDLSKKKSVFLNPPIVHYIVIEEKRNPCSFNPCGVNAECRELNGAGSCRCLPEYYGDPHVECRPECVTNSDCPKHLSCSNQKCRDPCPGTCGLNAECNVVNHSPSCLCPTGYTGNPLLNCFIQPITPPPRKILQ